MELFIFMYLPKSAVKFTWFLVRGVQPHSTKQKSLQSITQVIQELDLHSLENHRKESDTCKKNGSRNPIPHIELHFTHGNYILTQSI